MAPAAQPRALLKKGKKAALPPKKAGGFDYPTQLVGTSAWKGDDGQPVTVYYDPNTGADGKAVAQYVLDHIDDVMASCDFWFGVKGRGGNVIVAPDFGGAYHYGCDFDSGGDWYLSLSDKDTTVGLAVAEITESYMGLQAKGWNCGGSGGEALSRVLAEIATGGATGAMIDYSAGPSWNGANWIDRDSGTDQDYPSTGCGVLYLWWMLSQGHTIEAITQAGESGGVLAGNYRTLTGKTTAWTDFKAAVAAVGGAGSFDNDNPFNAPNPPYPAGSGPTPPPGPPPGPGTIELTGTLDFFGQMLPIKLTGTGTCGAGGGGVHTINVVAFLAAVAKLGVDIQKGDYLAAVYDLEAAFAALGGTAIGKHLPHFSRHLQAHVETAPVLQAGPPKP